MAYENKKLEEFNEYIRFRKVAVIGLGVSNIPLLDYLYELGCKDVVIFNDKEISFWQQNNRWHFKRNIR